MKKAKRTGGAKREAKGSNTLAPELIESARACPATMHRRGGRVRSSEAEKNFEAAMVRLVELYDFAPIPYVSLDWVGRVQEINFAAANLLGKPRNHLLNQPFSLRVADTDRNTFLSHLYRCRSQQRQVETNLKLIGKNRELIPVRLSSTPTTSFITDGAHLYPTVIFDLRERLAAEAALRQSEQRFRRYFDLGLIGMAISTRKRRYLEVNDHLCHLLGYSREELLEKKWSDLAFPDDLEESLAQFNRVMKGEFDGYTVDRRWIRKDGYVIDTIVSVNCVRLQDGSPDFFVTLVQDVTEPKRAEEALRASERRYRTLFDLVPVAVYTCDAKGVIQQFNRRAVELWGGEPGQNGAREKICGSYKLFYPDGKFMPHTKCPMARVLRGEKLDAAELEIVVERKDGTRRNILAHPRALTGERGEIIGAINCLYDITERKQDEEALRESEEQSRAMLNQTTVGIARSDLKGRLLFTNRKLDEMLGYEEAQLIGKSIRDITHPEDLNLTAKLFRHLTQEGEPFELEKRYLRKDGSTVWGTVSVAPICDAAGKPRSAVAAILDISERKRADEELLAAHGALRESEERFRLLVDGARDYAMFVLERNSRISFWSTGAERIFGWSAGEAIGHRTDMIFTEEDRMAEVAKKELAVAWRKGAATGRRWHLRKDGTRIWMDGVMHRLNDSNGRLRGFAVIARDATDERNAQEQLQAAHDQLEERVAQRTTELVAAYTELRNQMDERRRLEREVVAVTERERARISQDLHDSLCQELAATAFLLKSKAKAVARISPSAAQSLEEAALTVNANAGLARDLARGLHPFELESSGLIQALRELAGRTNDRVPCRFEGPRAVPGLDDGLAMTLYRIGQEAVLNALKHARPGDIEIKLQPQNGEVVLSVRDDGEALPNNEKTTGLGIHLMQYRANVSGGTLEIDSKGGVGTTVTCRIPLNNT